MWACAEGLDRVQELLVWEEPVWRTIFLGARMRLMLISEPRTELSGDKEFVRSLCLAFPRSLVNTQMIFIPES